MSRGPTLGDALEAAADAWSGGAGAKVMTTMAGRCVALLGPSLPVSELRPSHGQDLLDRLNGWSPVESGRGPLSAKAVIDYYRAFRRMLAIAGAKIDGWPRPPRLPQRKAREVASVERLEEAIAWLRQKGWGDTADLAHLILYTGLRATVEALRPEILKVTPDDGYDVLHVAYRAGREIPVADPEARKILKDPSRMSAPSLVSYEAHISRLRSAGAAEALPSGAFEPSALREAFRRRALAATGGNAALVADLMGRCG